MWQALFMPFVICFCLALALYGLASLPAWLREVVITFGCLFLVCTAICFAYLKLKDAFLKLFNLSSSTPATNDGKKTKTVSALPAQQSRKQTERDAHDAQLSEDDFLRDF